LARARRLSGVVVGFLLFLSALRATLRFEAGENRGDMPTHPSDGSAAGERHAGQLGADLSSAVVHLFSQQTGRGPTKARTTVDANLIVVMLRDTMTTGERTLVRAGKDAEVHQLRRAFQETMREDLVAAVEGLTTGKVSAFMSVNHTDPDLAAEIFVMDRAVSPAGTALVPPA
jgi:uncharacterized protein YbcI